MPLTILPRSGDDNANIHAQVELRAALENSRTANLIVYGEGSDIDRVVEVCVQRASVDLQNLRVVIWCPEPGLLSADQTKDFNPKGYVVVAVSKEAVADKLKLDDAQDPLDVEAAFQAAEELGLNS